MAKNNSAAATNALGIRYVVDGPPGLKAKLNELIRSLDYLFPRPSADIIPRVGDAGTLYTLRNAPSSSSAARTILPPWFLTGTIVSGDAKISVNPGLVNNFVPTIGGVFLGAFPRPTLTVTGSVGVIEIKATIDGAGTITDVIVQKVATATADTVFDKYKTIGSWTFASGTFTSVTSILNTNQTFYLCNATAIWE